MKRHIILLALTAILFGTACEKSIVDDPIIDQPSTSVEVSGDIKVNTTWTADKIYLLKGYVYVTDGATLTIQPGTIIKGDKATKASLIVTRGSKISAIGTADKPIVFTSAVASGGRSSGDWGGIILLGKAPVNQSGGEVIIEGGLVPTSTGGVVGDKGKYTTYGSTTPDPADNSGTLKYVRIEFAGIAFAPDNEINGLTMGGVGSGTTLDYIEVYRSGDDAYEWFGGTVTAKHLLAIGTTDDDFDTDFGFSGKVQFGLAQRAQVVADFSGSNGFESDNDATGTNLTPQTSPIFSNMTIIGPLTGVVASGGTISNINANYQHAAQIRRNSALSMFNSVLTNYHEGVYFDDGTVVTPKATSANYLAGRISFENNIIYNTNAKGNEVKGQNKADFETALRAANVFDATKSATDLYASPLKYGGDFKVTTDAVFYGTPSFLVKAGSAAESGAVFTNAKVSDAFFDKVTYRGAFGATDWSAGWASYDPQILTYTTPGKVTGN
jgi:hypothetical protein